MKRLLTGLLAATVWLTSPGCSGSSSSSGGSPPSNSNPPGKTGGDILFHEFTGNKRALAIIVKFLDAPPMFEPTVAGENEWIATRDSIVDALDRDSYGTLSFEVDYTWPPLLIDKRVGDYEEDTAHMDVRADAIAVAERAGYDVSSYDRELLFSPKVWTGGSRGWVRTTWIGAPLRPLEWLTLHEIGHTLSRAHANLWVGDPVSTTAPGEPGGTGGTGGESLNYGDIFDPMGTGSQWSRFLHTNPWFKLRAGWLDPADVLTVTKSGTYTITNIEDPDPAVGPTALVIRRDGDHDYWIFHRATERLVKNGPVIVRVGWDPFTSTNLLDMTPGSAGLEIADAALAQGQTFDDSAYASITVENITQGDGPIELEITVDEARQLAIDRVPVIDVLSPPREEGAVSGTVTFDVVVYDPDVGTTDGDGIEHVVLALTQHTNDFELTVATFEFEEAPYEVMFDTASGLDDAFYRLEVTATATDGGTNTILYRFMVDNSASASL